MKVAIESGEMELWGGKKPTNLFLPIHDGDEKEKEADIYKNSLYITAKSKTPPQVVNQRLQPIYKKEDIFSGCFCNVSITFVPFSTGAIKGVTTRLGNIQLVKKGIPIGGRTKAEDEFQVIAMPENTDYVKQQEQQIDSYNETADIEMNETKENLVSEFTATDVPQTELPFF